MGVGDGLEVLDFDVHLGWRLGSERRTWNERLTLRRIFTVFQTLVLKEDGWKCLGGPELKGASVEGHGRRELVGLDVEKVGRGGACEARRQDGHCGFSGIGRGRVGGNMGAFVVVVDAVVLWCDSEHSSVGSGRQRMVVRLVGVSEDENLNVGVKVLYS
jgi:hypothetical protein